MKWGKFLEKCFNLHEVLRGGDLFLIVCVWCRWRSSSIVNGCRGPTEGARGSAVPRTQEGGSPGAHHCCAVPPVATWGATHHTSDCTAGLCLTFVTKIDHSLTVKVKSWLFFPLLFICWQVECDSVGVAKGSAFSFPIRPQQQSEASSARSNARISPKRRRVEQWVN